MDSRLTALRVLAVVGILVLAVVGITWPAALHMDERTIGDNDFPGLQGEIFLQELAVQELATGRPMAHMSPPLTAWPRGEPIRSHIGLSANLYLAASVTAALPTVAGHNAMVMLLLLANALAMFFLARDHVEGLALPLLAALFMAMDPFVLLKLAQGFPQKAMVFPVVLTWLFLLRATRSGKWTDGLLTGLCLALTGAVYPPYAVYGGLAVALAAVVHLVAERRPGRSAGWAAATVAPLLLVGLATAALVHSNTPTAAQFELPLDGRLDPLHPLRGFPYLSMPLERAHGIPLGLPAVVLLLGVVGAVWPRPGTQARVRVLLAAGAAFFLVLAVGDAPVSNHEPVTVLGAWPALPHALLTALPFGHRLVFPLRVLPFALVPLTLLATLAVSGLVQRLAARRRQVGAWVLALTLACAGFVQVRLFLPELLPITVREVPQVGLVEGLRASSPGAVVFSPYEVSDPHGYLYAFMGVMAGRSVVNAVNPEEADHALRPPPDDTTHRAACAYIRHLAREGVTSFVHLPGLPPISQQPAWLDLLGEPEAQVGRPDDPRDLEALIWRIPHGPPEACRGPGPRPQRPRD